MDAYRVCLPPTSYGLTVFGFRLCQCAGAFFIIIAHFMPKSTTFSE